MSDGKDEREEFAWRLEEEKKQRREVPLDADQTYDWEPERPDF
jgi:hypothetical protein